MSVYVLSNAAMPGLVKIGRSVVVEERVAALSQPTGVPLPFRIEHQQPTADDIAVEWRIHHELSDYRVNPSREFFRLPVEHAVHKVELCALLEIWESASPESKAKFIAELDAAMNVANLIVRFVPRALLPDMAINFRVAGSPHIADAILEAAGQSIMDRSAA